MVSSAKKIAHLAFILAMEGTVTSIAIELSIFLHHKITVNDFCSYKSVLKSDYIRMYSTSVYFSL